jgi:hypothetical protein
MKIPFKLKDLPHSGFTIIRRGGSNWAIGWIKDDGYGNCAGVMMTIDGAFFSVMENEREPSKILDMLYRWGIIR